LTVIRGGMFFSCDEEHAVKKNIRIITEIIFDFIKISPIILFQNSNGLTKK